MSNGAITLQCPSCNGVFLTLQQRTGGMETCPHCAVAAPRAKYRIVEGDLFQRAKVQLPAKRMPEVIPSFPQESASAAAPQVASPPPPLTVFGTPPPARFQHSAGASTGPFAKTTAMHSSAAAAPVAPATPMLTEALSFSHVHAAPGNFVPAVPAPPAEVSVPPVMPAVAPAPAAAPPVFVPFSPQVSHESPGQSAAPAAPMVEQAPLMPFTLPTPAPVSQQQTPPPAEMPASVAAPTPAPAWASAPVAPAAPAAAEIPPEAHAPFAASPAGTLVMTPNNPATPPPAWPGLGLAVEPGPGPAQGSSPARGTGMQLPPFKASAASPVPAAKGRGDVDGGNLQEASTDGRSKSSAVSVAIVLAVLALMGWLGWTMWQQPEPVVVAAGGETAAPAKSDVASTGKAAADPSTAAVTTVPPTPQPPRAATGMAEATPAPVTPPAPVAPSPAVPEETRRAVPASPPSGAPTAAVPTPPVEPAVPQVDYEVADAERVIHALEDAESAAERLRLIAEPEKHQADLERFFLNLNGRLDTEKTEPNPGNPMDMSTQKIVPLFRTVTRRCPTGAIVRLITGKDSKPLLDWPFFVQSHNYLYDTFVNNAEDRNLTPTWFSVLCKRSHDFELKQPEREYYITLDAQGSLSSAGRAKVHVHKDSVAGRYLDAHMKWDANYISRLLLGKANIGGRTLTVVLDCEGTGIQH